jgi:hypothetical protein
LDEDGATRALLLARTGSLFLDEDGATRALLLARTGSLFLDEDGAWSLDEEGTAFLARADAMLSARVGTGRGGEDAVLSDWQGSVLLAGEDAMFGSNFFFAIPADQEGFLAAGLLGGVAGKSFGEQRGGAAERIVEDT